MDLTFSRKCRLTTQQDFEAVFANPIKITHRNLLALYKRNQSSHPRLGIILKKTIIKQAVRRVLLRRLFRESFRHNKDLIKGLDIIVLLRSECTPLDKNKFRETVDELWRKIAAKEQQ